MSATLSYEDAVDLLDADHKLVQKLGTGQCPVKAYNRYLGRLIEQEKVKPSWIVSHELPLEQAPEAYKNFDARKEGWTKVTLKPNG